MKNTTLCYLEQDGSWLLLHRNKKKNDPNHDKWIGIGGKFEENESPDDCVRREFREETGLELTEYRYCGIVTCSTPRPAAEPCGTATRASWHGSRRHSSPPCRSGRGTAFSCALCGSMRRFFR